MLATFFNRHSFPPFCILAESGLFLSVYLILKAAEECESLAVLLWFYLDDCGNSKTNLKPFPEK